jgi:hypothetical protein
MMSTQTPNQAVGSAESLNVGSVPSSKGTVRLFSGVGTSLVSIDWIERQTDIDRVSLKGHKFLMDSSRNGEPITVLEPCLEERGDASDCVVTIIPIGI